MRLLQLLPLLFLITIPLSVESKTVNVLFVGNSYTYYHEMPKILQDMCIERNLNVNIDQITYGGVSLTTLVRKKYENGYWRSIENGEISPTVQKILGTKWDYVILQEAPAVTLSPLARKYDCIPTVRFLDSIVKAGKGKTLLFQMYPVSSYPEKFCLPSTSQINSDEEKCSPVINNVESEFYFIQHIYGDISKLLKIDIVKVGEAFENCRITFPFISRFEEKRILAEEEKSYLGVPYKKVYMSCLHPNEEGAFLTACVFFKVLTGLSPKTLKYTGKVNPSIAEALKYISETVH